MMTNRIRTLTLLALLLGAPAAWAVTGDPIGETVFARGAVSAQNGTEVRILGKGEAVYQADIITSAPKSFGVLKMIDGTRISLRPDSVISLEEYNTTPGEESATLNLLKGGMRSITGSISKADPEAFKVYTAAATIGIRGTEFDARLCRDDCAGENGEWSGDNAPVARVAGRVLFLRGEMTATGSDGAVRRVSRGAPIYAGDVLETGVRSFGLVVFKDGTRTTLRAETRLDIEGYEYDAAEPEQGSSFLRLVRGGLRTLTGRIANRNPDAFKVYTATATIGVRGTGFDLLWLGACVGAATNCGLVAFVWDGELLAENDSGLTPILTDLVARVRGLNLAPEFIEGVPDFGDAPRPDTVDVDEAQLFGGTAMADIEPGLYVSCYEGYCALLQDQREIDLGAGEAGFASLDGQRLWRLERIAPFQYNDLFLQNINAEFFALYALLSEPVLRVNEFECYVE